MPLLRTNGKAVETPEGKKVFLRGFCLGGWLNLENFLTGFSGTESALRRILLDELGQDAYVAFFNAFHDIFINERDFAFMSHMGATAVRLPVNYRMLDDDEEWSICGRPWFHHIDKAVDWGKRHGIHIILDLHAAPGGQNRRWHSDNSSATALLWSGRRYVDWTCDIWKKLSDRYKNEEIIAAYDLLNEPEADDMQKLRSTYVRILETVRGNGDEHIIFLEGNNRGDNFNGLEKMEFGNLGYSSHNYLAATLHASRYPGKWGDDYLDKRSIENAFRQKNAWLLDKEAPSYVGEFGVLLNGGGDRPCSEDLARIRALADELEILNAYDQHWTIWSYKDLMHSGLLVSPESCEYRRRLSGFLEMKKELSLDAFVARKTGGLYAWAKTGVDRIAESVSRHLGDYSLNYQSLAIALGEQSISVTAGNFLLPLFVYAMECQTTEEARNLLCDAFSFEKCQKRTALVEVLTRALT